VGGEVNSTLLAGRCLEATYYLVEEFMVWQVMS
jgi:hypothetical protein